MITVCSLLTNLGQYTAWAVYVNCAKHLMLLVEQPIPGRDPFRGLELRGGLFPRKGTLAKAKT
jgi:hypothetical protein